MRNLSRPNLHEERLSSNKPQYNHQRPSSASGGSANFQHYQHQNGLQKNAVISSAQVVSHRAHPENNQNNELYQIGNMMQVPLNIGISPAQAAFGSAQPTNRMPSAASQPNNFATSQAFNISAKPGQSHQRKDKISIGGRKSSTQSTSSNKPI